MWVSVVLALGVPTTLLYTIYYPPPLLFALFEYLHPSVLFRLPLGADARTGSGSGLSASASTSTSASISISKSASALPPPPPPRRLLALTIDDAPSIYTPQLLDALARHHATATFFIIGSQVQQMGEQGRAILRRMRAEGHELGNHTMYDEKSILRPLSELRRQIRAVEEVIELAVASSPSSSSSSSSLLSAPSPVSITPTIPDPATSSLSPKTSQHQQQHQHQHQHQHKFFRPGGGFFTARMVKCAQEMGYTTALGNVYPHDPNIWSARLNARHVLSRVKQPGSQGSIVILHDRRAWSVAQLELVLAGLVEEQWSVVSLGRGMDACESWAG